MHLKHTPAHQSHPRFLSSHNTTLLSMGEYVVLVGDVGSGKSTVGEKLTGVEGRSSASSTSFTTEMAVFQTRDGGLVVADTPGSNAMRDKLSHNTEIASALNYADVSRILLVVKAETRIGQCNNFHVFIFIRVALVKSCFIFRRTLSNTSADNVVDSVRKYAEQLADLDPDCLGVVVTHMDTVTWTSQQFSEALASELGISGAVFSAADTTGPELQGAVLALCRKKYKFSVDGENFFRLFKVRSTAQQQLSTY